MTLPTNIGLPPCQEHILKLVLHNADQTRHDLGHHACGFLKNEPRNKRSLLNYVKQIEQIQAHLEKWSEDWGRALRHSGFPNNQVPCCPAQKGSLFRRLVQCTTAIFETCLGLHLAAESASSHTNVHAVDRLERLLRHLEDLELKWNALRPPQLVDLPIYPGAKLVRSTPRHMMTGEFARNAVGATSQNCYRKMILDFLVQNGGCAEAYEVDSHIEAEREGKFTEADLETLPSGGSIRWKNYVHWERKKLVLEELLYDGDPRGVWSLTEQGRKYYEEHVGSIL